MKLVRLPWVKQIHNYNCNLKVIVTVNTDLPIGRLFVAVYKNNDPLPPSLSVNGGYAFGWGSILNVIS